MEINDNSHQADVEASKISMETKPTSSSQDDVLNEKTDPQSVESNKQGEASTTENDDDKGQTIVEKCNGDKAEETEQKQLPSQTQCAITPVNHPSEDKTPNDSKQPADIPSDQLTDNNLEPKARDASIEEDVESIDDGDPIPSGTGQVSRDCSASELIGWSEILPKWHSKLHQRPKGLNQLVLNGIPEPLRGEVWQLLSGAQQHTNLMDQYRIYLTRSAPAEQIILRDVHRTYPAHENFRSGSGSSSLLDSLFKVCKAYAVYDEEVGYCQGLSFLVAALLLHMPEEQAFCVFVCIMQHYGLRDLFRNNFDELYLKFFQLERLLEDHMPDLYQHFNTIGIEPFTYASQWFLTVFTAKFPLNAVFYIMDMFLLDGMDTIFQVALALLGVSKKDLLALDFEGVLKYFRVQMPKRYRDQENVQQLILASTEISVKKLRKYAKAYEAMKQKEKLMENPVTRLQRENAKLTENNLRLEQENDDLARDLVASKIQLRAQLDALEDKAITLDRALTYSRQDCQTYMSTITDMEDERSRLEVEVTQLKEVCRRELQRAESEQVRDTSIIADYKKICSRLSKRLDHNLELAQQFVEATKDTLGDNESCTGRKCFETFCSNSQEFVTALKSDETTSTASTPSQGNSPTGKNNQQRLKDLRQASVESDHNNRPIGAYLKTEIDSQATSREQKISQLTKHVDELEVELARTKLALVEAECKCQQLTHDISVGATVTTSSNGANNISQASSLLSNKLLSMKAAISSSNRAFGSPKSATSGSAAMSGSTGGSTFAKLNNIISERISNIGQTNYQSSPTSKLPNSISTPLISNIATKSKVGSEPVDSKLLPTGNFVGEQVNNNKIIDESSDRNQRC